LHDTKAMHKTEIRIDSLKLYIVIILLF